MLQYVFEDIVYSLKTFCCFGNYLTKHGSVVITRFQFSKLFNYVKENSLVDTGRKLNVHKTFRRRTGRLLNVLCTFHLRHVSTGK